MRQVALLCIASVGMTFLIIAGGIDLSVGSSNAVTGVVCALLVTRLGLPGAAWAFWRESSAEARSGWSTA